MLDWDRLLRQFTPAGLPPLAWWAHHHQHFKHPAGCLDPQADWWLTQTPSSYYGLSFTMLSFWVLTFHVQEVSIFWFAPCSYCLGGKMPLGLCLDYTFLHVMTWYVFHTGIYDIKKTIPLFCSKITLRNTWLITVIVYDAQSLLVPSTKHKICWVHP